jgi:hypothetical protein
VVILEKTPVKRLVFVIDEHGRTLNKKSMHKLLSELFEKARKENNVDAIALNGKSVNNCAYLASQVSEKDISEWDIIYFHGSKYPPVLLSDSDKIQLVALLANFNGSSAAAIYKVLTDAGAYSQFD